MTRIEDLEYRLEWLYDFHNRQALRQDSRVDQHKSISLWPIRENRFEINRLRAELAHELEKIDDTN